MINSQLASLIRNASYVPLSEGTRSVIIEFLWPSLSIADRRSAAWRVIEHIARELFFSTTPLSFAREFKRHEEAVGPFAAGYREHLVHSVYVYALGLAIYDQWASVRAECASGAHRTSPYTPSGFGYYWALISLLHDCAYPVEICIRSLARYFSECIYGNVGPFSLSFSVHPIEMAFRFPDGPYDPDDRDTADALRVLCKHLIQRNVLGCEIGEVERLVLERIQRSMEQGKYDHGVIGAIALLKICRSHWRITGVPGGRFLCHYIDAASAVFIHHMYDYFWHAEVDPDARISLHNHPMAFLLILADRLQEWDKGELGDGSTALESREFAIEISPCGLSFWAPHNKHISINHSIRSILQVGGELAVRAFDTCS